MTPQAAGHKSYDAFVLMAETDLLLHLTPTALFPALLVAAALVWALWSVAPHPWLLIWAGAVATPTLARVALWRCSRRMAPDANIYHQRRRLYFLLTLVAGAAWGWVSFLVNPMSEPMHMAFVAIMVAGVIGGAMGPYGATAPKILAAYVLLILTPFAARLFWMAEPLWKACGLIFILYGLTVIIVGFRYGRAMRQAMELQLYNADLVAELTDAQQRIQHLAMHDPLTGLANRRLLEELFKPAAGNAQRRGALVAVYYFDLDRFKPINDAWGHGAGDQVLVMVAERLRTLLRPSDCLARVGGDEFVILAVDIKERALWDRVAQKIHKAVSEPMDIRPDNNHQDALIRVHVGASIGVSLYPEHGSELGELLRRADMAMYAVKADKSAVQRWALYDPQGECSV